MINMMILYGDINSKKYRKYYRRPAGRFKKYVVESAVSMLIVYGMIGIVAIIAAIWAGFHIGAF